MIEPLTRRRTNIAAPPACNIFHHQQHRDDHECCSPQQNNTLLRQNHHDQPNTIYTKCVQTLARPTWNRTLIILKSAFVVEYMFCIIFHSKFINL